MRSWRGHCAFQYIGTRRCHMKCFRGLPLIALLVPLHAQTQIGGGTCSTSTWCVPCVKEFPGLVSLSRRLGNRDFELITISVDDPKEQAKVQQFLEKQHAAIPNRVKRSLKSEGRKTNNYLFTGANQRRS